MNVPAASANPTPALEGSTKSVRLADLRALQRALEAEGKPAAEVRDPNDTKGRLLDIRC